MHIDYDVCTIANRAAQMQVLPSRLYTGPAYADSYPTSIYQEEEVGTALHELQIAALAQELHALARS